MLHYKNAKLRLALIEVLLHAMGARKCLLCDPCALLLWLDRTFLCLHHEKLLICQIICTSPNTRLFLRLCIHTVRRELFFLPIIFIANVILFIPVPRSVHTQPDSLKQSVTSAGTVSSTPLKLSTPTGTEQPSAAAVSPLASASTSAKALKKPNKPTVRPGSRAPGALPTSPLIPPKSEIPNWITSFFWRVAKTTGRGARSAAKWTADATRLLVTNPKEAKKKTQDLGIAIKAEAKHLYLGSKLFVAEVSAASHLLRKIGRREQLTRRERNLLRRTMGDIIRMVPFVVIVLIPFAELGLPVLLKLFPNMLPSQFEKADQKREAYKRSLNVRLEIHGLLQEVLSDYMNRWTGQSTNLSVKDLLLQLESVRKGETSSPSAVYQVAKLFKDELTLNNMPRGQLATLAKYLNLSVFVPDSILRLQLAHKMKSLKQDDILLWKEGVDSLTLAEVKSACNARGMRAIGLQEEEYRQQLTEWLELSVIHEVPTTLLLLSRAYILTSGNQFYDELQEATELSNVVPQMVVDKPKPNVSYWVTPSTPFHPLPAETTNSSTVEVLQDPVSSVNASAATATTSLGGSSERPAAEKPAPQASPLKPSFIIAPDGTSETPAAMEVVASTLPPEIPVVHPSAAASTAAAASAPPAATTTPVSATTPAAAVASAVTGKATSSTLALQESISTLDLSVISEVVLNQADDVPTDEVAGAADSALDKATLLSMRLEALREQMAMIALEKEASESAAAYEKVTAEATKRQERAVKVARDAGVGEEEARSLWRETQEAIATAQKEQGQALDASERSLPAGTEVEVETTDASAATLKEAPASSLTVGDVSDAATAGSNVEQKPAEKPPAPGVVSGTTKKPSQVEATAASVPESSVSQTATAGETVKPKVQTPPISASTAASASEKKETKAEGVSTALKPEPTATFVVEDDEAEKEILTNVAASVSLGREKYLLSVMKDFQQKIESIPLKNITSASPSKASVVTTVAEESSAKAKEASKVTAPVAGTTSPEVARLSAAPSQTPVAPVASDKASKATPAAPEDVATSSQHVVGAATQQTGKTVEEATPVEEQVVYPEVVEVVDVEEVQVPVKSEESKLDRVISFLFNHLHSMQVKLESDIEQQSAELRERFESIDTDADGRISKEEVARVLQSMFKNTEARDAVNLLLERLEFDERGTISIGDLEELLDSLAEGDSSDEEVEDILEAEEEVDELEENASDAVEGQESANAEQLEKPEATAATPSSEKQMK